MRGCVATRRKRTTDINPMYVFNRRHKRKQKDRAATLDLDGEFDYLRNYVAEQLVDRLQDISRDFPIAVDLGCGSGHIGKKLDDLGGIDHLLQLDMSCAAISRCQSAEPQGLRVSHVIADEEAVPLQPESVDLVMSSLSLHWVNDLPGTFAQIHRALKPDGVFLAAMLGGDTLNELRSSFVAAEQERHGGVSPHVSPLAMVSDVGTLLQHAGFNIPCVDSETTHVGYADAVAVWEHLQGMGDSNATVGRLSQVSLDTMLASAAVYQSAYHCSPPRTEDLDEVDGTDNGYLPATVQIIYMIGWKPEKSQQRPDARGSAIRSLKELGTSSDALR